ncbi:MAG: hypothetical protein NTW19_00060 [Planctomycetota bacterium]|nr:hypothetical protein [Planctomycetota bacterium]
MTRSRGRLVALAACLLALAATPPARGHESPVDHVDRDMAMWVADGRLFLSYRVQVSERMAMMQLNQADVNSDGKVSDAERRKYFETWQGALAKLLQLQMDGRAIAWTPVGEVAFDARLGQTYLFSAALPANLSEGAPWRLKDLFSRQYPGQYRYRQTPALAAGASPVICELEKNISDVGEEHPEIVVLVFKLPKTPAP